MSSGRLLADVAGRLVPGYVDDFDWGAVWSRPLESGLGLEWATLAAIASGSAARGWRYSFPILNVHNGRALFPLRNEVPYHHGAQPGHPGATQHAHSLAARFLQALVPKLLLEKEGRYLSVFREGCPYHKAMGDPTYDERPDILFLRGRPTPGFPEFVQDGTGLDFSFDLDGVGTFSGRLRVINSSVLPLRRREPSGGLEVPVGCIVECSVNKPREVARAQLDRYSRLFSTEAGQPPVVLVTGNDPGPLPWPTTVLDLSCADLSVVERNLRVAADVVLDAASVV
jgi:hypothetical protein